MKKLLKLFLFLLSIITFDVKAKEYSESFLDKVEWISGDYVNKEKGGSKKYQQMYTIKRKSDGKFVYCIEPGVSIKDGKLIKGYDDDYLDVTKFTQEEWERITKLAYYGYGYKDSKYNHTGIHWYTITQFMIWKTVPNGYDIYFTDKLNGKKITKYQKEINEMETILTTYHHLPSFNSKTYKFLINDKKEIIDTNNVLSSYMSNTKGITINDNKLIINDNIEGAYNYEFIKENNRYGVIPIVYIDSKSQNLMSVGDIKSDKSNVQVVINDIRVYGHKLDSETMNNVGMGEAVLIDAIYGIYDINDNLIEEVKTDINGEFVSKSLPSYGKYYIKEISPSNGYNLNNDKYYFEVSENNLKPIINLYEDVIKAKIEIVKYTNSINNGMLKEKDAKFAVYNKDNKLYKEAVTDDNGYLVFDLPYGEYTIKQLSSKENYQFVKDFKIIVSKTETIKRELIDELNEAKIKLIKRDLETNEIIKKKGLTFKIYDLNNNHYLCENDSCLFETNEDGYFITNNAYLFGRYRIEEQNTNLDNYYWNKNPLEFVIDENVENKLIEINFYNKEIKGSLEFTKTDYSTSDPLPNTLIEIYDSNGNTVFEGRTDEKGKIIINELPVGKYFIREKEAPIGYMINEEIMPFEIKDDKVVKCEMKDERIIGSIRIIKIGEEKIIDSGYHYIDTRLSNVYFKLYAREDIILNNKIIYKKDEIIYEGVTDNKGELLINNLIVGKYYLKEDITLEGYLIDNKEYDFQVSDNKLIELKIKNYLIKGTLEFTKTSVSDSIPLPNTLMEFYDIDDHLILSDRTDNNGQIIINAIPYGKYYYKEIEAPDGYYVNPDKHYFEIKENNEIIRDTLADDVIIVPDTYKEGDYNYLIFISIGGLCVFIKKIIH